MAHTKNVRTDRPTTGADTPRIKLVLSATGCPSVRALAKRLGISRSALYRIFAGDAGPGVRARIEIAIGAELATVLMGAP